jgi:hypothetical protein
MNVEQPIPETALSEPDGIKRLAPVNSLRTRMLVAISASILVVFTAAIWFGAREIRVLSAVQIEHKAILLAHSIEAAIASLAATRDITGMQNTIDRRTVERPRVPNHGLRQRARSAGPGRQGERSPG